MAMDASTVPELLRPLWNERAARVLERIQLVVQALRQESGTSREEGLAEAHKLHGLLGTFGFDAGSEEAGKAESLLEFDDSNCSGWMDAADRLELLRLELLNFSTTPAVDNESE